jgi:L-asparaginase / beta-aspartyl-peptidase
MPGRIIAVILSVVAVLAIHNWSVSRANDTSSDDPLASEIKNLLNEQIGHWNTGDIDGFMQYYWKSDDLTFSSGGTTRRGWDETLRRYRERYPTPERMGTTTFSDLEVRPLGGAAAMVLGRWSLDRKPDPIGGNFTLVLENHNGRWVIVHDHTSQQPAE